MVGNILTVTTLVTGKTTATFSSFDKIVTINSVGMHS